MKFTWDEAKRKTNLAKHGFDFAVAEAVFAGMTYTFGMTGSITEKTDL